MSRGDIHVCSARAGWSWFVEGVALFFRQPLAWLLISFLLFGFSLAVMWIPVAGSLVITLFWPALSAGLYCAARDTLAGKKLSPRILLAAFRHNDALGSLLVLGGVAALAMIVFAMAVVAVAGVVLVAGTGSPWGTLIMIWSLLAIGLLVAFFLVTGFLYGIPLVFFDGQGPGVAMRSSVRACLQNWLPWSVFSIPFLLVFAALVAGLYALLEGYGDVLVPGRLVQLLAIVAPGVDVAEPLARAATATAASLLTQWLLTPAAVAAIFRSYQSVYK